MSFGCRPGLAQHAFIKSLQLESINPSAWVNLGGLYLHRDKLDLANKVRFDVVGLFFVAMFAAVTAVGVVVALACALQVGGGPLAVELDAPIVWFGVVWRFFCWC
jgi:hypothetical protein